MLVIASNTAHIAADAARVEFPSMEVLHIGDTTAVAVKARGMQKVGGPAMMTTSTTSMWMNKWTVGRSVGPSVGRSVGPSVRRSVGRPDRTGPDRT